MAMRKIKSKKSETMSMSSEPMEPMYPSLYLSSETLPEGKDWEIGKIYRVTLDLKMTGMSERKNREGEEDGSYDFDIVAIDPGSEAIGDTKDYDDVAEATLKKTAFGSEAARTLRKKK